MAARKTTTDQAKDTISEKVIDPMKRAGEAVKAGGEKIAEGGSAIGLKVVDQVEANLREAFAAMRAAAGARDLSEVMKIQADYLRDQGNRSMAHAREIGDLIVQIGRDSAEAFKGGADNGGSGKA